MKKIKYLTPDQAVKLGYLEIFENKTRLPVEPDSMGEVVSLNTPEIRRAIQLILLNNCNEFVSLNQIRFCEKRDMLRIKGKDVLCYNRNHHYPKSKDHLYAVHMFLNSVTSMLDKTEPF